MFKAFFLLMKLGIPLFMLIQLTIDGLKSRTTFVQKITVIAPTLLIIPMVYLGILVILGSSGAPVYVAWKLIILVLMANGIVDIVFANDQAELIAMQARSKTKNSKTTRILDSRHFKKLGFKQILLSLLILASLIYRGLIF